LSARRFPSLSALGVDCGWPLRVVVAPYASPVVSSVEPEQGAVGVEVTLRGEHLAGATSVAFGGVSALFEVAKGSAEIWTTVPRGSKTGRIAVTTPGGRATTQTAPTRKPPLGAAYC
jgi:hypothetical protein